MWKDYSKSYLKNNKSACISIMVAILFSSFFISAVTAIIYNMWTDNIDRLVYEEGDWQGRITGPVTPEQLRIIENSENVEKVAASEFGPDADQAVSVYFTHPRRIYQDFPEVIKQAGLEGNPDITIEYHNMLLTEYYIYSEEEKKDPPLLLTFYIFIMAVVCVSLIMIIYNAFGITMSSRLHQLGILQSVGATPKQIRAALLQEAAALSLFPILAGSAGGVGANYLFIQYGNRIGDIASKRDTAFTYNPIVLAVTILFCVLSVFFAAWRAAWKLSRVTPLDAVRNQLEAPVRKVRQFRLLSALFGIEGELARKSLYTKRKEYRTAGISLTLSFLVFSFFLNFMTLSDISTQYTYFERYKDVWDFMITVQDNTENRDSMLAKLKSVPGLEDCASYLLAEAYTCLDRSALSPELLSLGGPEALNQTKIVLKDGKYMIPLQFVILDDASYQAYCGSIGMDASLLSVPSSIVCNRIWDNVHSDFRNREFLPYVAETQDLTLPLFAAAENSPLDIPAVNVLGYTDQAPVLREEYDYFSLLQIMSASSYEALGKDLSDGNTYYRILSYSDDDADRLETALTGLMDKTGYEYTFENRKGEEIYNVWARKALKQVMGIFCGMLAFIGVANVFANTLGTLAQRKREFARYLSIGLTPAGLKKILVMEALFVSLKPILVLIPLNILFIVFSVYAKYDAFIDMMPLEPIFFMCVLVLVSVALAYYLAGRNILRSNIIDALKNDTLL